MAPKNRTDPNCDVLAGKAFAFTKEQWFRYSYSTVYVEKKRRLLVILAVGSLENLETAGF